MPIPLLIPIAMAAASLVKGIANAVPTKADKQNKADLKQLERLKAGGNLGLTDEEQQKRSRDLLAPVRTATTQVGQQQARALAASGQGLGGGDLSAIRQDAGTTLGNAGMAAQSAIGQQDEQKKAGQLEELEQRRAYQAMSRKERKNAAFDGITQAASSMGNLAGVPPGTYSTGLFGNRVKSALDQVGKTAGLSDVDQARLKEIMDEPGAERAARQALRGENEEDPQVAEIIRILKSSGQAAVNALDPSTVPIEDENVTVAGGY